MQQMYGAVANLDLQVRVEGATRATLTLPYRDRAVGIDAASREIQTRGVEACGL
jgi:hypothetical protein